MKLIECNGKQYKACCANCKYYLGRKTFNENNDNCDNREKKASYGNQFFPNHYPSDEACSYFVFEAKKEYRKLSPVMKAALSLKEYCRENECSEKCELFNKEENHCRLSFSVNEWDI